MYQVIHQHKSACSLLTLLCCSACSQPEPAGVISQGTLQMTPQTARFAQDYYNSTLHATTSDIPLQVSLRIGAATDANVCDTGELYGPYTVTNNTVAGEQTASAGAPTLRLANMGALTVCMIITSPVNATLDLSADSLAMTATECNETPASIADIWTGAYTCTSACGDSNGNVELTIVQDGYSATYTDDANASYEGTVCGNTFRYAGGGKDLVGNEYRESGTFILNSDGTASKTSTYSYIDGSCSGSCSDPVLVRK